MLILGSNGMARFKDIRPLRSKKKDRFAERRKRKRKVKKLICLFVESCNRSLKITFYSSNPAIQQSSNPAIQQSSNPAIQQSNNPAIQQSSNPAIQQSNNPAIQQSN
jgi:hypothetical protein